jgi:hypothetical protein
MLERYTKQAWATIAVVMILNASSPIKSATLLSAYYVVLIA